MGKKKTIVFVPFQDYSTEQQLATAHYLRLTGFYECHFVLAQAVERAVIDRIRAAGFPCSPLERVVRGEQPRAARTIPFWLGAIWLCVKKGLKQCYRLVLRLPIGQNGKKLLSATYHLVKEVYESLKESRRARILCC